MGYLAGFTWGRRATVVGAALDAARAAGPLLVIGPQALARALAGARETWWLATEGRLRGRTLRARADALPVADGALGALVAATRDAPHPGWLRALRDGGALVIVASLAAEELTRRALCAGLSDVEQRRAGALLVTSGRVWRPRAPGETAR